MDSYLSDLVNAIKGTNFAAIDSLCKHLRDQRKYHNTLFVCGNGGSHAVAEHWGVDLIKAAGLHTHTLGANPALSTALANDSDYSVGFSTELAMRASQMDTLVALSCSGTSRNIASVLNEAHKLKMPAFLITGLRAPEYDGVRVIHVFSHDYGILEDVFMAIGHYLTRALA